MSIRSLLLPACVLALACTAAPAAAQTENPVPGVSPGACTDQSRPTSGFTGSAARRAGRANHKHVLRGTARDTGCGVDRVAISVARKHGKLCKHLTRRGKLGRRTSCAHRTWLPVKGTAKWSFTLPKRLSGHSYLVRTRAVDFSGNAQRERSHRLRVR
jgi:hypothetical protein